MSSNGQKAPDGKIIFISALGGALEMYDFIIYISFSKVIGQLFFPAKNHLLSQLSVLVIFAAGYILRPFGGIVLSHFGDKYGRKQTFSISIALMAVVTLMMGLIPTFQSVGVAAPILLLLLRMIQGFSLGGELPGGLIFAVEHVDQSRRGLAAAWIFAGISISMAAGSAIYTLITHLFSNEQVVAFGWRIPFVFGGIIGAVSFCLRSKIAESPMFLHLHEKGRVVAVPFLDVCRLHFNHVVRGFGLVWLGAVIVCVIYLCLPLYLSQSTGYSLRVLAPMQTLNLILYSMFIVIFGYWSDKIGRKILLTIGSSCFVIFSVLIFSIFYMGHLWLVMVGMILFSIFSGMIVGCFPCAMVEFFPTAVRYTGFSLSYNIGFAVLGGLSPLIVTLLFNFTHNPLVPGFYLTLGGLVCLWSAICMQDKSQQGLDD